MSRTLDPDLPDTAEAQRGAEPLWRHRRNVVTPAGGRLQASRLLPVAALLVPLLVLCIGGWSAWRATWAEAEAELTQTADATAEFAGRLLSGYGAAASRINDIVRGLSDAEIRAREPELHRQLQDSIMEMPQLASAFIVDRVGIPLLSAALPNVSRESLADWDFFVPFAAGDRTAPYISVLMVGRSTRRVVFVIARPRRGGGNGLPPDSFDGTVNVGIEPGPLAASLAGLANRPGDAIALIREDGAVLAATERPPAPGQHFAQPDLLRRIMATDTRRAILNGPAGEHATLSMSAIRRLADFPLAVVAIRSHAAIAANWRSVMATHLMFGVPASIALLLLSLRVRRTQQQLAAANARLGTALGETEAELRRAQRIGRIGGFEIDLRTGLNRRSAEYMALQGQPARSAVEAHQDWVERLHPEDRGAAERHFLDAISHASGAADYAQGYRIVTPEGRVRWIQARAEIERDAAGRALRMVGAHIDVTALKEAEVALRESEERLRRVQRIGQVGGYEIDLRTGASYRSPEYRILHGLPFDTVCETHADWVARLHPEDREAAERQSLHVQSDASGATEYAQEYRIVLPSTGETRWIAARGVIERDAEGRAFRMEGAHIDITAAKQAEAALARSEAKLKDLLDTLDLAALLVRDLDGTIRFWSEGCRELFGWTASEALGQNLHALVATTFPIPRAALDDALLRDGAWSGDLVQLRRDGRRLTVATRMALRRDERDRPAAVAESLSDVTALRRARAEREQMNRDLEQLVREEVKKREEAQVRAAHAERLQALGQLAGGIAHDLNNVLQMVTSGARLMEEASEEPDRVRRMARLVQEAAQRGASVTSRLLAFARRADLRAEPIDAYRLLSDLCEVLSHTLGRGIECRVEASPDLPQLLADKGQLETVLLNLATNARDAMPEGGTLTLQAESLEAGDDDGRQGALPAGRYIRLAVADTGVGMAAETLARVTEPFFTTKAADQGTGLGLSMAKGFAEQSGGGLSIDSTLGAGTTVALWLPQLTEAPAAPLTRTGLASVARRRLLLVDDDPVLQTFLRAELELTGYAVTARADGAAGLAWLDSGAEVDALVSDLTMPGMSGVALIEAAQARRPGLPAILLTGFAGDTAKLSEGGAHFMLLRKPVAIERLASALAELLAEAPAA